MRNVLSPWFWGTAGSAEFINAYRALDIENCKVIIIQWPFADLCGQWIVASDAFACKVLICEYYCGFGKLRINRVILHGTEICWFSSVWQHIHIIFWNHSALVSSDSKIIVISQTVSFLTSRRAFFFFPNKTLFAFLMHLFVLMRVCNCNSCSLYWMFDWN